MSLKALTWSQRPHLECPLLSALLTAQSLWGLHLRLLGWALQLCAPLPWQSGKFKIHADCFSHSYRVLARGLHGV